MTTERVATGQKWAPRKLVLCFDGTGNVFSGHPDGRDTNIVKIFRRLDQFAPNQFHYYQPGIGTYVENESSSFFSSLQRFQATVSQSLDSGLGLTFRHHVIAGYEFLMRYYTQSEELESDDEDSEPESEEHKRKEQAHRGDHIYIFGFSRGAYTARFLAEMVQNIGLLSQGNEEMVRFAWKAFSQHQSFLGAHRGKAYEHHMNYMNKFKRTFCRTGVRVHFLGLFDCVNSVSDFEVPILSDHYRRLDSRPAEYVRHAVSIHERRLKFKPALFEADLKKGKERDEDGKKVDQKDKKQEIEGKPPRLIEKWFIGSHADIGGGWGLENDQSKLISDIPLDWMLHELYSIHKNEPHLALSLSKEATDEADENGEPVGDDHDLQPDEINRLTKDAGKRWVWHDMLQFGAGTPVVGVISWWIIELLPFFPRLELEEHGVWKPRIWPPNMGARRDVPKSIYDPFHHSVRALLKAGYISKSDLPEPGDDNSTLLHDVLSSMAFKVAAAIISILIAVLVLYQKLF